MNKLSSLLTGALMACGCAAPYDGHFSRLIADGRFGAAPQTLEDEATERAGHQYPRSLEKQDKFVYSYYEGYECGLKCPRGGVTVHDGNGPHNRGLQAGRAAAIADVEAGKPRVTLREFGFVECECRGKLKLEFEKSEFLPDNAGGRWWIAINRDVNKRYDEAVGNQRPVYVYAHLRGFLSPDRGGGVGHFNQYDREFVITEILEIRRFEVEANQVTESGTE